MKKYIGKYRVDCERDINGDPIEDGELFLRCLGRNKGGKVYRYDDHTLVCFMQGQGKVNNTLKEMDIRQVPYKLVEYNGECDIYFSESYLDDIADLIGISTFGASIPPNSIKNHPRRDEIKAERDANLSEEEKERRRLSGERLKSLRKNDVQ